VEYPRLNVIDVSYKGLHVEKYIIELSKKCISYNPFTTRDTKIRNVVYGWFSAVITFRLFQFLNIKTKHKCLLNDTYCFLLFALVIITFLIGNNPDFSSSFKF